eukprot:1384498-Amorphochlora_amoeboformis.AAC.1
MAREIQRVGDKNGHLARGRQRGTAVETRAQGEKREREGEGEAEERSNWFDCQARGDAGRVDGEVQ